MFTFPHLLTASLALLQTTTTVLATPLAQAAGSTTSKFTLQTLRIDVNPTDGDSYRQAIYAQFTHDSRTITCTATWREDEMKPMPEQTTVEMSCDNANYKASATQNGPLRGNTCRGQPGGSTRSIGLAIAPANSPTACTGMMDAFHATNWVWNFVGDPNFTTQFKVGAQLEFNPNICTAVPGSGS